jgi:tetratricopeptide (TPR) repeat protein
MRRIADIRAADIGWRLILPGLFLGIWFVVTDVLHLTHPAMLPAPTGVVRAFIRLAQSGELLTNIGASLLRIFYANVAALALGVALCALPALADPTEEEPDAVRIDPDYAAGKKSIEARDWVSAIKLLSSAALRDTRNADIQNYLGFAYRNSGQMDLAFRHYAKSLQLNPNNTGGAKMLRKLRQ